MTFKTSRTILFGDCDPAGVIYAPRVAHFVVEAALEFLSDLLEGSAARQMFALGILPPARALTIDYLYPMAWDDRIEIEVVVHEIREHAYSMRLTARNVNQEVTFRATLAQVCVSPETKRPVALPDRLRAALVRSESGLDKLLPSG